MHFTSDDGYQSFLVFPPIFSSVTLDINKEVTKWILTGISSEKMKPFDTIFEPTISNLVHGRVILKLNNSVLVQRSSSALV